MVPYLSDSATTTSDGFSSFIHLTPVQVVCLSGAFDNDCLKAETENQYCNNFLTVVLTTYRFLSSVVLPLFTHLVPTICKANVKINISSTVSFESSCQYLCYSRGDNSGMAPQQRKHVLVMALPAFGHYIPGLELAKKIIPHHDVTMVMSIHKLQDIVQRDLLPPSPIQFHTFDDGFTFNIDENMGDLRGFSVANLQSEPYYETFINSLTVSNAASKRAGKLPPVDAIFCDITMPMPFEPSVQRQIPIYGFMPQSAQMFAAYSVMNKDTRTVPDDVFFSGTDASFNQGDTIPESFKNMQDRYDRAQSVATGILLNSFDELEPDALVSLKSLPKYANKPVCFVGPLLPTVNDQSNDLSNKLRSWLDRREERSVVYFSFGTVAVPSSVQLTQVAEALLSLQRPFVWSLRSNQQSLLPEKFLRGTVETLTDDMPYLILHWTPQKQILTHPATAVFVSHCGWNSTLEAVAYGVPVVAWPMLGDQHHNAGLVEKWGIGKMMPAAGMKSEITPAADIAGVIETVGGWTSERPGSAYWEKVNELSQKAKNAVAVDGQSTRNLLQILNSF
ncbi:uncharacterized protein LOC129587548 [Paramacrobiotus metropolitanus]|uniref:uncharacterized protein LOC129587548 n=1 Tax=Paramacrobiotus metropolitanus TaxID=2943436 RepID=UPI00244573CB|nr:uncharacterized protein LOC129587548 [Paramacrobiotus metropolitanus]